MAYVPVIIISTANESWVDEYLFPSDVMVVFEVTVSVSVDKDHLASGTGFDMWRLDVRCIPTEQKDDHSVGHDQLSASWHNDWTSGCDTSCLWHGVKEAVAHVEVVGERVKRYSFAKLEITYLLDDILGVSHWPKHP